MTQITIDIEPLRTTHQSAVRILKNRKTGQMFVGRPKNSKAASYKNTLIALIKQQVGPNFIKYDSAIRLTVYLWFPVPKSRISQFKKYCEKPFATNERSWWAPMTVKPDWDNSSKLICDALVEAGVIADDNIIYSGGLSKYEHLCKGFITINIQPFSHNHDQP